MTPLRAELIVTLRTARGMTQGQLGARSGVTRQTIWRIEAGQAPNVGLDTLERIARVLGCSVAALVADAAPAKPRRTR
jgi:transcriptional regulator with XRE-family HTH domain